MGSWKTLSNARWSAAVPEASIRHDGEVVENFDAAVQKARGLTELQFGHDGEVVENANVDLVKAELGFSFNSATTVRSWKTRRRASPGR